MIKLSKEKRIFSNSNPSTLSNASNNFNKVNTFTWLWKNVTVI